MTPSHTLYLSINHQIMILSSQIILYKYILEPQRDTIVVVETAKASAGFSHNMFIYNWK